MKYLYITIVFFTVIACNQSNPTNTILSGSTKYSVGDNLYLLDKNYDTIKKIHLKQDKTFLDTLEIEKGYYYLTTSQGPVNLFLEPNQDLNISFFSAGEKDSVYFEGKGATTNNYLFKKTRLEDKIGIKEAYAYYAKLDEDEFLKETDSIKNLYINLLKTFPNLNKSFIEIETNNIEYSTLYKLSNFQDFKRYVTTDTSFQVSDNFPKYYENINLSDEKSMKAPSYFNFVMYYLNKKTYENSTLDTDSSDFVLKYLKTIKSEIENPSLKNDLIHYVVKTSINNTRELDSVYHLANKMLTTDKHKAFLKDKYNLLKKATKGAVVSDFKLKDNFDNVVSLSDFKGNIVYIDIWATWCLPCLKEVPYLKQTEKYFEEQDVTFISICKSDTKEKWLNKVKKDSLGGIQLFAENDELKFFNEINLVSIPRFVLIDREGKIIDSNAPRPSNKELIELIENSL